MISIDTSKILHFDLKATALSHGWVHLKPFHWDDDRRGLKVSVPANGEYISGTILQEKENKRVLFLTTVKASHLQKKNLTKALRRMLSLDQDFEGLIKTCSQNGNCRFLSLIQCGWGRILRCSTPWEDAVKTICTTNASWPYTQQMCENLCVKLGENAGFPMPDRIVAAGNSFLRKKVVLGYRSEYVYELAKKILGRKIDLESLEFGKCEREYADEKVRSIKGLGPYGANHMLVLLGWHSFLPVDREVMKFLKIVPLLHGRCPKEVQHYLKYGDYRFIAYKLDRILHRKNWIGN